MWMPINEPTPKQPSKGTGGSSSEGKGLSPKPPSKEKESTPEQSWNKTPEPSSMETSVPPSTGTSELSELASTGTSEPPSEGTPKPSSEGKEKAKEPAGSYWDHHFAYLGLEVPEYIDDLINRNDLFPSHEEPPATIVVKLGILASIVLDGQSITEKGGISWDPAEEEAVFNMSAVERLNYFSFLDQKQHLPKINWIDFFEMEKIADMPTDPQCLEEAIQRAEGLNLLYNTHQATARHVLKFLKKNGHLVHLLDAHVKLAESRKNIDPDWGNLTSVEMADVKVIDLALTVPIKGFGEDGKTNVYRARKALMTLGRERDRLNGILRGFYTREGDYGFQEERDAEEAARKAAVEKEAAEKAAAKKVVIVTQDSDEEDTPEERRRNAARALLKLGRQRLRKYVRFEEHQAKRNEEETQGNDSWQPSGKSTDECLLAAKSSSRSKDQPSLTPKPSLLPAFGEQAEAAESSDSSLSSAHSLYEPGPS